MQGDESISSFTDRRRRIEVLCHSTVANMATAGNSVATWSAIKTALESLLNHLWQQRELQGRTAADAYAVHCGLGETMTAEDVLTGTLRVTILLALERPAEFTEISIRTAAADPS